MGGLIGEVLAAATTTVVVGDWSGSAATDWLTAIGTVGAVLAAVALGLGLKEWLFRPKLRVAFSPTSRSHLLVTGTVSGAPAAYVRLGIANDGRGPARHVGVSLLSVEESRDDAWQRVRQELDGVGFNWSNRPRELFPDALVRDIPPRSQRPLDLFAIVRDWQAQGEMPMELQVAVHPANRTDHLPPGSWRIAIETSGDNAPPKKHHMAFRFDGGWPGQAGDDGSEIGRAVAVEGPSARPIARPPIPEYRDPRERIAEALQRDEEAAQAEGDDVASDR